VRVIRAKAEIVGVLQPDFETRSVYAIQECSGWRFAEANLARDAVEFSMHSRAAEHFARQEILA